jgi:Restriction endonuclease
MAKPGDEYMELVGDVAKALDPGSSVRVGEWIDGPDGKRELDVEVRGTIDGSPHFILIECKDWRKRVGVEVIDALDSKRRDVHANQAIVYSNSGFTAQALRKATRVGIGAASALNAGDGKVRAVVQREIVAKRLSVDSMQSRLYEFPGESLDGLDGWNVGDLQFDESPVVNWISELSRRLIVENENATSIAFRCAFNRSTKWSYHGRPLSVVG